MIIRKQSASARIKRNGSLRSGTSNKERLGFNQGPENEQSQILPEMMLSKNLIQGVVVVGILASLPFLPQDPALALPSTPNDSVLQTADAGRLLLTNDISRKPVSMTVRKQATMQDERLSQCEEGGKNWEQCFFYGTETTPDAMVTGTNIRLYPQPLQQTMATPKSKIPTW